MEKYLMNIGTGSVDTEENWKAEMSGWPCMVDGVEVFDPEDQQRQFDSLVEVVKEENGDWVEAE